MYHSFFSKNIPKQMFQLQFFIYLPVQREIMDCLKTYTKIKKPGI